MDLLSAECSAAPVQKDLHNDAGSAQNDDEFEKANPSLQVAFSTIMDQSSYYKIPSFYKQVKCLLISWDKDSDDLHTGDEVRLFELYGENIANDELGVQTCRRSPRPLQLQSHPKAPFEHVGQTPSCTAQQIHSRLHLRGRRI